MIQNFIVPALLGLLLLVSFIGYGSLLRRTLFSHEQPSWANEAAWGMAFVIMMGGVLVFASIISAILLDVLLLIGVVLMVWDKLPAAPRQLKSLLSLLKDMSPVDAVRLSLYFFVFELVAIQYLYSVNLMPTAIGDDLRAYFAFPKQILELGTFSVDPFDLMRLGNGLGGQSMLLALMLANSDYNNLMLVDGGVALLICVGLVLRIGTQRKLAPAWSIAIALLFLCLPFALMRVNTSSVVTGMVMLLAIFAFLDSDDLNDSTPAKNAFIVGLLASGACALKSNLIPPLVFSLAFSYLWLVYATRFNRRALLEAVLVPVFVFLLLLPWMLTLRHTSGTLLWPIFGSGFAESNYGSYVAGSFSGGLSYMEKWDIIFHRFVLKDLFPLLIATGAIVYLMVKMRRRAMAHAYIFGALAGALSILMSFDLTNAYPYVRYTVEPFARYIFVGLSVALLVALAELASYASDLSGERKPAFSPAGYPMILTANWRKKFVFLGVAAALLSSLWYFNYGFKVWEAYPVWFTGLKGKAKRVAIISEAEYFRHQNAQAAVPVGEAIFSSDLYTLLYDYSRNRILNVSIAGGASPPPGLPYFRGPEAVASYLKNNGIRYVAYRYKGNDGDPVLANLWRLYPTTPYTKRAFARAIIALDGVLGELGHSRSRVYDDGTLFIVDLNTPSKSNDRHQKTNYFQLRKILTLSWANTQGFDSRKIWTYGHAVISDLNYELSPEDNILALNTFGYIPWRNDLDRLNIALAVNGKTLPMIAQSRNLNSFYFSLESITEPITNITINSNTFDPLHEQQFKLRDYFGDEKTLGVDVDTIQIMGRN